MVKQLPKQAEIVVIGGGIIGTSVAYHLTKLGRSDVVLLERKQLTSGTTWHAAGLVGQLRATKNLTQLSQYTAKLYETLAQETGLETGFKQRGSISLATTKERMEELNRLASMARCFGVEVEEISCDDVSRMWPLMDLSDVVGAIYLPKDGQTNATDTTQALARGARNGGAQIFENTLVSSLLVENGKCVGVKTDSGSIKANYVVNCAGMWGRQLGNDCGANIPLHAAEHYYLVTEPISEMHENLPVVRDQDRYAYFKEETGKLLLGFFEPNAAPWGMEGIPHEFCFDDLPADWDRMLPYIELAMNRMPILEETGIQLLFNGPESFTPDDRYLLGPVPNVSGLFVAAGFNSVGIQSAGGGQAKFCLTGS